MSKDSVYAESERCCADVCSWCKLRYNETWPIPASELIDGEWIHFDGKGNILGMCQAGPIYQRLLNQKFMEEPLDSPCTVVFSGEVADVCVPVVVGDMLLVDRNA